MGLVCQWSNETKLSNKTVHQFFIFHSKTALWPISYQVKMLMAKMSRAKTLMAGVPRTNPSRPQAARMSRVTGRWGCQLLPALGTACQACCSPENPDKPLPSRSIGPHVTEDAQQGQAWPVVPTAPPSLPPATPLCFFPSLKGSSTKCYRVRCDYDTRQKKTGITW